MGWLGRWWDSVELWLVGLPFVLQVPLVLVVVVPVCAGVAVGLDRGADLVAGRVPTLTGMSPRGLSPRTTITATLVGLLALVVLAWLVRAL